MCCDGPKTYQKINLMTFSVNRALDSSPHQEPSFCSVFSQSSKELSVFTIMITIIKNSSRSNSVKEQSRHNLHSAPLQSQLTQRSNTLLTPVRLRHPLPQYTLYMNSSNLHTDTGPHRSKSRICRDKNKYVWPNSDLISVTNLQLIKTSFVNQSNVTSHNKHLNTVWLGGVVVSALGMTTRRPRFKSQVAPLFHWVATLGKLFTHTASPVSQLQETGVQKGVFGA